MPLSSPGRQAALARAILTSATDFAIITTDREGWVTSWNPGAEHLLGWSSGEMMGEDACRLFTPEDLAAGRCEEEMMLARLNGRAEDERWHMKADGSRLWGSGLMMRFEDEETDEHIGYLKIMRDRTPQHHADEVMRESERQYRALAEALPGFVFTADTAGRKIYANDGYLTYTGQNLAGLAGDKWLEFVHPDDRADVGHAWREAIEGGQVFTRHIRFRRHDGAHRAFACHSRPECDEDGNIVRWVGTCVDIDEQRQAEAQLAYEKGLLDAVISQAPVGISIAPADEDARPVINDTMRAMLGHGVGGTGLKRYVSYGALHSEGEQYGPDDYPTVRALKRGERVERELMRYRLGPNGPNAEGAIRRFEITSGPVRDADGAIVAAVTIAQDVEERLAAVDDMARMAHEREQALLQARQMAGLVEQSGDFIGEAGLDGEVSFINPAGRALVGLPDLAAVGGTRILDYFTPASQEVVLTTVLPAVKATGYWEGELHFRHFVTGDAIPVIYNIFPLHDAAGTRIGYGTVTRDLRERQHADRLRNGMTDLADCLRNVDDVDTMEVAASEVIGRTLSAGRVGYGTLAEDGDTFKAINGWTAPDISPLAGTYRLSEYGEYVGELRAGRAVVVYDVRLDPWTAVSPDALVALNICSFINLPVIEHGRTVAVLYVHGPTSCAWRNDEIAFVREAGDRLRQASERRRAELALRALNASLEEQVEERSRALRLYQNIVQSDASPVVAFGKDLRVIAFNRAHTDAYRRVYGIDQQIGDSLIEQFVPEQAVIVRGFMERALADESFIVREEFGDPDREVPYWQITYNPLRDDSGAIVGAFHHAVDVTVEMRAAHELAETQEALRQSQKMEAVGQLTGGLAHDFNNLLTGISGSLEMMTIRIGQGRMGDVEKYNVAAQGAAKRAAALTHRLLAFSRRQTLDPKPTQPNRLIENMVDLIERTVGPEVRTHFVAGNDLWTTLVDPNQLENALLNLCINARDAMPGGGKLTIETNNRILDERAAQLQDLEPGRYVALCVTDSGSGMTPEVIAKAFDPFFTTKPIGVGTGLGLSMIYGFARQSGGHVRIYSEIGEGTTVCIYLPRHLGEAEMDEGAPDLAEAPRAEDGETVLVVDDEPSVRMLVTDVLEELGYTAIEAADGAAGLKIMQSDIRIDLLVSDVGLPGGMNGRQMADAGRISRPDLKILFITGYAENAAVGNGHLDPGMHVMTKPFAMEALATRIRTLIEGR